METALKWKDELLEHHKKVVVRDNVTQKENMRAGFEERED